MNADSAIFNLSSAAEFREKALETFRYQARHLPVYREFLGHLDIDPFTVSRLEEIPFLPIAFFKTREIIAEGKKPEIVFTSSGTSGSNTSRHPVASLALYRESFMKGFAHFYGDIRNYRVLALLPSYLEREGSSLVLMAEELIKASGHPESGFFLYEQDLLRQRLLELEAQKAPTLLIGVSFALLDFAEKYRMDLKHTIIMETGGMKGRRRELVREELHARLQEGLGTAGIHSEYGMTELLSQAYSSGEGRFQCPPWMKVMIREVNDPFSFAPQGRSGGINIIDLANRYSCSFIATEDLGRSDADGSFEVLGRFDQSDLRGCNLLVS